MGESMRSESGHAAGSSSRSSDSGYKNGSSSSSSGRARLSIADLYKEDLLGLVIEQLYEDLVPSGRETCQSQLRRLTTVCKGWLGPVNRRLYQNPFFGSKERAYQIQLCFEQHPERGKLVKKLIFGEGSSTDIQDWPTTLTVPSIIRHCPNVEIVGFDGLKCIDLDAMKDALLSAPKLSELRCCDLMPDPWPNVHYFFNEIVAPCKNLTRLRLYGIHSDQDDPSGTDEMRRRMKDMDGKFQEVALSQCAIRSEDLKAIFANSSRSTKNLHLEYPQDLPEDDLLEVLGVIDGCLKVLSVEGYRMQDTTDDEDYPGYLVERILDRCPELESLMFTEGFASPDVIPRLLKSKLRVWSFSCTSDFRPHHWIKAFSEWQGPTAKCFVRTTDWTQAELRKVRIAAWRAGVAWLESDAEL